MANAHPQQQPQRNNGDSTSLIKILEDGVRAHSLTKSETLQKYTGFANFSALQAGGGFLPMNGNRAVNRNVVAFRVADNLRRLRESRPLADFGQIFLVVVSEGPPEWLVMDGQHRLETMKELHVFHGVDVHFQFCAKVVRTEAEAHEALMQYQEQHPPDPRTFFKTRQQTALAEEVLEGLRNKFPALELWPEEVVQHDSSIRQRPGLRVGDVSRPLLSDNIVMGILGSSGLLREGTATAESVMRHMIAANEVLKGRDERRADLGPGVTNRMRERARGLRCFLGLLRETKLEYSSIGSEVDAYLAARGRKDNIR